MKILTKLTFLGIFILNNNVFAQINFNQQLVFPPNIEIVPRQIPLQQMQQTANVLQARYDRNKQYRDNLIDWIKELKQKINDRKFQDDINKVYVELRSYDGAAFHNLTDALDNAKKWIDNIINNYNKRVEEKPIELWKEATSYTDKKDYNKAITLFSELIILRPDVIESYRNRGYCYFLLNMYNEAIDDLNVYLSKNQNDAMIYEIRGYSFFNMANFQSALYDFEMQVKLDPTAYSYFNRGQSKSELNNQVGAIADYTKAINLKPDFSMAYNNRGWCKFELNNFSSALLDLNKAIELDPDNWIAYDSRQETKFALGDLNGSLSDCNKALELNPECSNSIFFKGRINFKKGNKLKACEYWEQAVNLGNKKAADYIKKYCN